MCVCHVLYWFTGSTKKWHCKLGRLVCCSLYAAVDHLKCCPKSCESINEEFFVQGINSFQVIGDKQNNISWYKTTAWVNCQQLPDCCTVPATFVVRSGVWFGSGKELLGYVLQKALWFSLRHLLLVQLQLQMCLYNESNSSSYVHDVVGNSPWLLFHTLRAISDFSLLMLLHLTSSFEAVVITTTTWHC